MRTIWLSAFAFVRRWLTLVRIHLHVLCLDNKFNSSQFMKRIQKLFIYKVSATVGPTCCPCQQTAVAHTHVHRYRYSIWTFEYIRPNFPVEYVASLSVIGLLNTTIPRKPQANWNCEIFSPVHWNICSIGYSKLIAIISGMGALW